MARSLTCGAVVMLALAAACGSRAASPPSGPGSGHATGPGASAGTGATADPDPAPAAPLTRDECVRMIDHVLEVGMADQRARKAPEYVPTAEQVATIREQMVAEQLDACLAMPRAQWSCAMAAAAMDALYACGQ